MPELPEVETVCRGLEKIVGEQSEIKEVRLHRRGLRQDFNKKSIAKSHGQKITAIRRRAKYLLIELEKDLLVSHLGMTGSWRLKEDKRKHDHIEIYLQDGRCLVYHDPRRFGQFDLLPMGSWQQDQRFCALGPEPLDERHFTADYLLAKIEKSSSTIKGLIMDQKIVVGVGNIYASEALFLAGINPKTKGREIKKKQVRLLVHGIKEVLSEAIRCGGTTISDFRQAGGSKGYFQNHLYVYGKQGEKCCFCSSTIESQVIGGRNSFWCASCQGEV